MLDFQPVREKKITLQDLVRDLTKDDLRRELNEMYDEVSHLITDCTDAHITFEPADEKADDPYAVKGEETIAWTLGHVIVHLTASMEEAAAIASELARGVTYHGRSRSEVPWREATTIAFCRARLEESRRMCLTSLEMWPDEPHMENTYSPSEGAVPHTCVSRFASGLRHASDHLGQIAEIVSQAKQAI
ncbi:MAG: DinB family protein [Anaerolineae bacterium]|nr:DinB family protein [Anaerolineae bacterium]MCI0608937.1 DinB family protein [Anaerolineae bacterium]